MIGQGTVVIVTFVSMVTIAKNMVTADGNLWTVTNVAFKNKQTKKQKQKCDYSLFPVVFGTSSLVRKRNN